MTNKERILEHNDRIEALIEIIEQKQFGTIALPPLANPASPDDVKTGKEYIDEYGNAQVGTYEPESGEGGGEDATGFEDAIIDRTITGTYSNSRISTVGTYAFYSCSTLTGVDLPNCQKISANAFYSCTALKTINIPECSIIAQSAFYSCKVLTEISAPKCKTIMNNAFQSCVALSQAYIPEVTAFSAGAFASCTSLKSIDAPKCATLVSSVFNNCTALETANVPLITTVGSSAFRGCTSLKNVNVDSAKTVATQAFSSCRALTSIDLPLCSVIQSSAFAGCSALSAIYLRSTTMATLSNVNAFALTPMSNSTYLGYYGSIYVPADLVDTYKAGTNWATYSNRITSII